jgi:hypothetical protein
MMTDRPENILPYERSPEHLPVAAFSCAGEACTAAGRLEAAGVGCQVVEHAILQGITARGATIAVETEQFHRAVEVLAGIPARGCLLVRLAMTVGGEQDPVPARTPTRAPTGVVRRIFKWWYRQTGAEPGAIPPRATAR